MTQRQQQIIEEYLFDVFVKLEGNGEKNENWWNRVFLLEAITSMRQHDYTIATFCEPSKFFQLDEGENEDEHETNDNNTEDTDPETNDTNTEDTDPETNDTNTEDTDPETNEIFTLTKRHEAVDNYLENYYQHEDYYYYFMIATTGERGKASEQEQVLQQQYLYVYTLENSEYFMNKFIYGDDVMLK